MKVQITITQTDDEVPSVNIEARAIVPDYDPVSVTFTSAVDDLPKVLDSLLRPDGARRELLTKKREEFQDSLRLINRLTDNASMQLSNQI